MHIVFWVSLALVAYTVGLYPLVMWVVCRLRRATPAAMDELPHVTLIIPAYNEECVLEAKIENSLQLDYPPESLQILVVSDGSADRTVEIARRYEPRGVTALESPSKRGKANAINAGVAASCGTVLCLSDANVMLRTDALRKLVSPLGDTGIGAVTADVRLESEQSDFGAGESLYYRLERAVQLGESQFGSVMGVDGGLYVIRRDLFRTLPADTILDDFVTSMNVSRQLRRIVYVPDAVATENGTPSWRDEFQRRVRVMVGAVQSIKRRHWPPLSRPIEFWQYVSHKLLRWVQPIWLLLLLVSSGMLWTDGPPYRVILVAQTAFYAIALVALLSPALRNTRLGAVAFYFAMSHVAMLVGLVKGLVTRPSGTWKRTPRINSCEFTGPAALAGEASLSGGGIGSQRKQVESATDL